MAYDQEARKARNAAAREHVKQRRQPEPPTPQERFNRVVADEIAAARMALGLSQEKVGELRGVNRDAQSKFEREARNLSLYDVLTTYRALAAGLDADHPAVLVARRYLRRAPQDKSVSYYAAVATFGMLAPTLGADHPAVRLAQHYRRFLP